MGARHTRALTTVLVDLSGTLHIEDKTTPGAVQALRRLRDAGLKVKFITNTTKESRSVLHNRLQKLGFDIQPQEVFSSLWAARELLERKSMKPFLLVDDKAIEDFQGLTEFDGEPDAVVIGLAPEKFDRPHLNQAFRHVLKGAQLIAIHEARYYMRSDGLALGPGPFVKMLEYATGVKATVVGKPSKDFFAEALGGVDPKAAVMIGDDCRDDIGGSQGVGIDGYLVRTGKYRAGDEHTLENKPYRTVENFSEAVDDILKSCERQH